jgi:L-fuconolactonase
MGTPLLLGLLGRGSAHVTESSPPADASLVDAHHHVWDLSAYQQPWLDLPGHESLRRTFAEADLRTEAAAAGLTATVVVQTVIEPGETPDLLALAAGSGLIAGVVGWIDLEAAGAGDAIAALRARPDGDWLRGIRHPVLVEADPDWLQRPAVLRGLAAVAHAGLCYDIVGRPDHLPAAAAAAAAVPDLIFVLDHLGNPDIGPRVDEHWAHAVRQLAVLPNTVCKLSGILGEPPPGDEHVPASPGLAHLVPYYETVLDAFGPERLMFGSDWPVCTLSASYPAVVGAARALTAGLAPAERAAVLGGTARRIYQLA